MFDLLPRLIVVLTALSTVLAGMPPAATPDVAATGSVSAQQPAGDDDAGNPRGEREAEETEVENELDIKLFAEQSGVCGPRCDSFVSLEVASRAGGQPPIWPTAAIRGPPASA